MATQLQLYANCLTILAVDELRGGRGKTSGGACFGVFSNFSGW